MRDELVYIAYYDRKMDLPNSEKLLQDIREVKSSKGLLYLVAFDIFQLRRLNDAYGRALVDELLGAIVDWVGRQGYPGATLYRIEGDEFALLIKNSSEARASEVADSLFERFETPWTLPMDGEELHILCGASVSVVYAGRVQQHKDILNLIERTIEVARETGQVAIHNEEMDRAAAEHLQLEMSLKACVNNGMEGFDVHFQPIVDPAAGLWRGLESLCRWESPELGRIPPPVFIREAEQLGLIDRIGLWVLRTAVARCKAWQLDELERFFVSVNLSPLQLANEKLPAQVAAILREYQWPGEKLTLEITESEEVYFGGRTRDIIDQLRFNGIRISLDDFGTGYSSFMNLRNLPASFIKTEREFIRDIEQDSYMQYFFSIMTELSHATDMKLIAEGVETRE